MKHWTSLKNISKKEVVIQFSVPGSTVATWKKNKKSAKLFKIHHWSADESKWEHTAWLF